LCCRYPYDAVHDLEHGQIRWRLRVPIAIGTNSRIDANDNGQGFSGRDSRKLEPGLALEAGSNLISHTQRRPSLGGNPGSTLAPTKLDGLIVYDLDIEHATNRWASSAGFRRLPLDVGNDGNQQYNHQNESWSSAAGSDRHKRLAWNSPIFNFHYGKTSSAAEDWAQGISLQDPAEIVATI
jgi:hypothetical protein